MHWVQESSSDVCLLETGGQRGELVAFWYIFLVPNYRPEPESGLCPSAEGETDPKPEVIHR